MSRDELIEAMARGIMLSHGGCNVTDWSEAERNPRVKNAMDDAEAALSAIEAAGMAVVPDAALKWLNGEGPDDEGHHFGDSPESRQSMRPFWWRKVFTRMIEAGRLKP
jgi:hypothetical protein